MRKRIQSIFFKDKKITISLTFLTLIILLCLFRPYLTPYSYSTVDLQLGAVSPSPAHWFGTDQLGRDLFTRVLYGGLISLAVGLITTLIALIVGVIYGSIAGFYGGVVDTLMMRFLEILYALPFIIIIILMTVIFQDMGNRLLLILIAIGSVEWLTIARVIRGQIIVLKTQAFIEAARMIGQSSFHIFTKHLLPNLRALIITYATLTVPSVMLLETFVSFLGLGIQPPQTSWGLLIKDGAATIEEYPWMIIFPGLIFSLTFLSLNLIGDSLQNSFDPKSLKVQ